jgi:hypothetical protein
LTKQIVPAASTMISCCRRPWDSKQLLIKDIDKIEFNGYEATIDLTVLLPTTDTDQPVQPDLAETDGA